MTPAETTALAKTVALELGFEHVGVARPVPDPRVEYYRQWLAAGHAGSMSYLARNLELRENPACLLPGARSVIAVALSYHRPEPADAADGGGLTGRVAQYARGADYHRVVRTMLEALGTCLRDRLDEHFEWRVFVDSGPVSERHLAAAAGLGWIGKSTMLLHERLGSYLFLGELFTTLELLPDEPVPDRCGNCTRCLEACPTKALTAPHQLDASRCIAYFTIEHRGEVPAEFHGPIGDWVFGCDICQNVCPFNSRALPATHPEITAERIPTRLPLLDLLNLHSSDYRRLTDGTAARRATRSMWRRNAAIALGNALSGLAGAGRLSTAAGLAEAGRLSLAAACEDTDPTVRHAARHTLKRAHA